MLEAGSHEESVRIPTGDLLRATGAEVADICRGLDATARRAGRRPVPSIRPGTRRAEEGQKSPRRGAGPLSSPSMEVLSSRVLLSPRDIERSLRFYEQTLGLGVYREWGQGRERAAVFFLGSGLLEVSGSSAEPESGAVRLFLQVRDLRATREWLAAQGVPIEQEPAVRPWGLVEMVARDPDGLALVLVEVPPDHPLRRGG